MVWAATLLKAAISNSRIKSTDNLAPIILVISVYQHRDLHRDASDSKRLRLGDVPAATTEVVEVAVNEDHFQGIKGKIGLKHQEQEQELELFVLSIYVLLLLRYYSI
ncbi:unnamed protein product [Arabis nemorensis]|uniref:Uncharacterized protein n=1 Tax=Arabis nemorensis TaxID=586526 RepID=A0A565C7X3_9BRAS|nr:unnamed protein product [Arabis nemorensis]